MSDDTDVRGVICFFFGILIAVCVRAHTDMGLFLAGVFVIPCIVAIASWISEQALS